MSRAEERWTQRAGSPRTTSISPIGTGSGPRVVRWVRWLVIGVGCGVVAGFLGGLWQPRTDQPLRHGERGDR